MRVEPFEVGSVVHVVKRGARGMEIVRDVSDQWRFARILYLLNDIYQDPLRSGGRWRKSDLRSVEEQSLFVRPEQWPERNPLVAVLSWTLLPNHFHLLLEEIREGGISKFMQRLCGSMTLAFNERYQERGSIFQGAYRSRTINVDEYLQYVLPYIAVKNVFELYPGGLKKALKEFEKAWQWAETYPFTSFQTHAYGTQSPIMDTVRLEALGISRGAEFKRQAKNMLFAHAERREEFAPLFLEAWD